MDFIPEFDFGSESLEGISSVISPSACQSLLFPLVLFRAFRRVSEKNLNHFFLPFCPLFVVEQASPTWCH